MVGRRLTILVFCLFFVVVSALPLPTVRKTKSQPQKELYSRATVERRSVDSEGPPHGVSEQKIERRSVDSQRLPPSGVSEQKIERQSVDSQRLPPSGVSEQKIERRSVDNQRQNNR